MQRCTYPVLILIGFSLAGCGAGDSKTQAVPGPDSGTDTQVASGGFVDSNSGDEIAAVGSSNSDHGGSAFAGGFGVGGENSRPPSESFDGEIEGNYVLQQSGEYIGYRGKGGHPLVVKSKSLKLPLMPMTDEIGEQLLKLSGSRVRLNGWRQASSVVFGRGDIGAQQGWRGAIPDHTVHFLLVETVEALHHSSSDELR